MGKPLVYWFPKENDLLSWWFFPHLCSFAGGYPLKIVVVRYLYYFIFIIANCETTKG